MHLFRVFPWDERSDGNKPGGPLYVNRHAQGVTRHGLPDVDGILYCSQQAVSAIAERLQEFRGQTIENDDLTQGPYRLSLVRYELAAAVELLDLTQTSTLSKSAIDPLHVATKDRMLSQRLARQLHDKEIPGFIWWSSLEPSWNNVSLFESRAVKRLAVKKPIVPLRTDMPEVIEAAKKIGVFLKIP